MILLITASPSGSLVSTALEKATGRRVLLVAKLERAAKLMRGSSYTALVIDTSLLEMDLSAQETFGRYAGNAVPVYVSPAISSPERIAREVQAALKRREKERQIAMRLARSALRDELRDAITGILLSSEIALQVPAVPEAAQQRLRALRELALQVRSRLNAKSTSD